MEGEELQLLLWLRLNNDQYLVLALSCKRIAKVFFMDTQLHTSVCWYRFAVSGDVLPDLLALEHRVHHHPSNNCKEWNIIIIIVITIIIIVIIINECTIIPPITARRAKCTGKQIEPLRERKCPQFLNPDLDPVKRKIIQIKMRE